MQLPRIGLIRTHESTRKLARRIQTGTARIRSATVSFQRGRWHVSFSVELPDPTPAQRTGDRVVGVDLGITSLAVLSTGEIVPNPRHLDNALGDAGVRVIVADRWFPSSKTCSKTATGGNGCRHGKTQIMSQRRPREVATP